MYPGLYTINVRQRALVTIPEEISPMVQLTLWDEVSAGAKARSRGLGIRGDRL
jgi:hypothetical protein